MKKVWIGTCGQVVAWKNLFHLFSALELNITFYKFPTERQVKNWKKYLREGKEKGAFLSMKAHQLFTHPLNSPTWKRSEFASEERKKLRGLVGCLKRNELSRKYLKKTRELAEELGLDFILFQLPAACEKEKENIGPFFREALKILDQKLLGLEIRWPDPSLLMNLRNQGIVPVFDPFLEPSLRESFFPDLDFLYLRLHGTRDPRGKLNYRHQYTEEELKRLKDWVLEARAKEVCVFFNNVFMKDDALRFKKLWQE